MKKLLAGTAVVMGMLTGSAFAADLPMKAPPPVAVAIYNWTGFYVGANLGWAWGTARYRNINNTTLFGDAAPGNRFTHAMDGAAGGLQVGYNWQMNQIVFGLEGSWDWTGLSGSRNPGFGAGDDRFNTRVNSILLLSGRLGVAMNNWLLYVKGGYAGGDVRARVRDNVGPFTGSGSQTRWENGYNLGLGAEVGITRNWSVAGEYNYVSLNTGRYQLAGGAAGSYAWDVAARPIHLLTARVNYRFN